MAWPPPEGEEQRWRGELQYTLNCIRETRAKLDRNEMTTVRSARAAGFTWTEIGTYLGIDPEAVERRWHEVDPIGSTG